MRPKICMDVTESFEDIVVITYNFRIATQTIFEL